MYKIRMIKENPIYEKIDVVESIPGNPLASELQGYGVNTYIVSKKSRDNISYINNYQKSYKKVGHPVLDEIPTLDLIIEGKKDNIEGFMLFVEYDSVPTTSGELISSSYCHRKAIILLKEGKSITFKINNKKVKVKVKKGKLVIK